MEAPLEKDVQRAICEYLAARRIFFWRQNTSPVFDRTKGAFRAMPAFALRGVADVLALNHGRFYAIEVKRKGGKLSPYQEEFKAMVEQHGGTYVMATSVDDVLRVLS